MFSVIAEGIESRSFFGNRGDIGCARAGLRKALFDGQAGGGHGRLPRSRGRGLRLRELDSRRGPARWLRTRFFISRIRAGVSPAALLRGQGAVPMGGALG